MLNKIDVAVYPVDPKALAIDSDYDAIAHPNAVSRNVVVPRLKTEGENRAGEFATMDLIALETGVRAFYNANALGLSIQWAVDDSRVTYVLGFYPEESSWDGKYHKLEVRVNRPAVEVRSRRSYFASDGAIRSLIAYRQ
jgi:VWFA-related protein